MIKLLFIFILAIGIMVGCQFEKVNLWTDKSTVWFTAPNYKDSTIFTFALCPESVEDTTISIPISMCGNKVNYDREIGVKVVGEPHNALSRYEVIQPVIVPADSVRGFLRVKLYRTENLDVERDSVVFQLETTMDLNVDVISHTRHWLFFSNLFEQPEWWAIGSNAWFYLGEYDQTKMRVINEALGSVDDPMSGDIAQVNVNRYKLAQYVRENNPTYADGTPVEFPFMENE